MKLHPIENPHQTLESILEVRTNARRYSIRATVEGFRSRRYDLLEEGNLVINGQSSREIDIVSNVLGLTPGEETVVTYIFSLDFTVPAGNYSGTVSFTAFVPF